MAMQSTIAIASALIEWVNESGAGEVRNAFSPACVFRRVMGRSKRRGRLRGVPYGATFALGMSGE
jgi:hypothetical protein